MKSEDIVVNANTLELDQTFDVAKDVKHGGEKSVTNFFSLSFQPSQVNEAWIIQVHKANIEDEC